MDLSICCFNISPLIVAISLSLISKLMARIAIHVMATYLCGLIFKLQHWSNVDDDLVKRLSFNLCIGPTQASLRIEPTRVIALLLGLGTIVSWTFELLNVSDSVFVCPFVVSLFLSSVFDTLFSCSYSLLLAHCHALTRERDETSSTDIPKVQNCFENRNIHYWCDITYILLPGFLYDWTFGLQCPSASN